MNLFFPQKKQLTLTSILNIDLFKKNELYFLPKNNVA